MVRIAVDATVLSQRTTGAGRIVRGLLAALPEAGEDIEVVSLAPERTGSGVAWELRGAAAAAEEAAADVVFTVRELVGRRTPPTVLHVFEPPSYRVRPAVTKAAAKDMLLAALLSRSLHRAAAVTAGSATTAAWLRERHGVAAEVLLPGVDREFYEPGPGAERPEPYLLHVAGSDPRDATDLLGPALERLGPDAPLVVVAGGGGEGVRSARVERVGWVSDDDLRALYRGALALVHLARYEAYGGLPALEAMALGTPVVALDAPGVTEALDGAALLVERPEAELLASAIRRVAVDADLRRTLAVAGRQRVEPLRWERVAAQLADVCRRAAGPSQP